MGLGTPFVCGTCFEDGGATASLPTSWRGGFAPEDEAGSPGASCSPTVLGGSVAGSASCSATCLFSSAGGKLASARADAALGELAGNPVGASGSSGAMSAKISWASYGTPSEKPGLYSLLASCPVAGGASCCWLR